MTIQFLDDRRPAFNWRQMFIRYVRNTEITKSECQKQNKKSHRNWSVYFTIGFVMTPGSRHLIVITSWLNWRRS